MEYAGLLGLKQVLRVLIGVDRGRRFWIATAERFGKEIHIGIGCATYYVLLVCGG